MFIGTGCIVHFNPAYCMWDLVLEQISAGWTQQQCNGFTTLHSLAHHLALCSFPTHSPYLSRLDFIRLHQHTSWHPKENLLRERGRGFEVPWHVKSNSVERRAGKTHNSGHFHFQFSGTDLLVLHLPPPHESFPAVASWYTQTAKD